MPRTRSDAHTPDPSKGKSGMISLIQKQVSTHQQLCMACYSGDVNTTKKLLLTMKNFDDKNPLRMGIEAGHQKIVAELLQHPDFDVNTAFERGLTPLHLAASKGHTALCKYLIDNNADSSLVTADLETILHLACQNNRTETITFLSKDDPSALLARNKRGELPFHIAVRHSRKEVITMLLRESSEFLQYTNNDESQAIHLAAQVGNTEVMKLLLEEKADPTVYNNSGNNALHVSILYRHRDTCQVLLDTGLVTLTKNNAQGQTCLHLSVMGTLDNPSILDFLIENGVEVDTFNEACVTPLYVACQTSNVRCVRSLLEHKADAWFEGDESVLHLACLHKQTEIVRLLLSFHRGLISQKDNRGYLPVHVAAEQGAIDIIDLLLTFDEEQLNITTASSQMTPLLVACQRNQVNLAWHLLDKGADFGLADKEGNTAIHYACENGEISLVKRLHELGCNFSKKNMNNRVPFELVKSSKVAAYLIQHEINAPNLKMLDLSNRQISLLPENESYWKTFEQLTHIDLSGNQLSTVPISLLQAPELKNVILDGNPLEDIPSACKKKDYKWKDIQAYLLTLKENCTRWNEQKLFLIGESGSGRTSLLSALDNGKLISSGSRRVKAKSGPTPAIVVHSNRSLMVPKKNLFQRQNALKMSATIWQIRSDMATLCPFFFTDQSVYLLTFNMLTIKEHIISLDNWVQQIRQQTQTSICSVDILFVGTHKDDPQCTKEYIEQIKSLLLERFPSNRYPQVKGVYPVSNRTGSGFNALVLAIKECGNKTRPFINPAWLLIHQHLKELQNTSSYITWDEYRQIAHRCGAKKNQLPALTRFLCSTSTILFSDDFANCRHPDVIILDPQWIVKIISSLLSITNIPAVTPLDDLVSKLPAWSTFDRPTRQTIIRIITNYRIVFEMKENQVLCPWILPGSPTLEQLGSHGWTRYPKPDFIEHGRIFDFCFVPLGFIERIISNMHQLPNVSLQYSSVNQLLLSLEDQLALISYIPRRIDQRAYQLRVLARTPRITDKEPILFIHLIEHIQSLIASYYVQLKSTMQSWVICSHCTASSKFRADPFLFPYSKCVTTVIHDPKGFLYCRDIHCVQRQIRMDVIAPDISLASLRKWMISPTRLHMVKYLGEGATGEVNLMKLDDDLVAVKLLSTGKRDFIDEEDKEKVLVQQFEEFAHEINLMTKLHHPNIIQFRGLCERPLRVIMEYAPCGDLHQLIREQNTETGHYTPKANELSWPFRYHIALDIAYGLQYLARKGIIHRDIRSPNIFMLRTSLESIDDRVAVVADFGLSIYALPKAAGSLRTWRWLAPEVFHYSSAAYDTTSDVYSFGVVLWELIEGAYPFGEFTEDEWEVQEAIVKDHLRPTIPDDESLCNSLYAHLIRRCWSALPLDRPTWKEIITTLLHLLDQPLERVFSPPVPSTSQDVLRPPTPRTVRFSSFSEATKPAKVRAQFELPEKVQTMLVVDATLWMGTKDGDVMIYSAQLAKGTLKNPQVVRRWKAHSSGIIDMRLIQLSEKRVVWCCTQDGSVIIVESEAPYETLWTHNPAKKDPITSVSMSTWNKKVLIWTALLPCENFYAVNVWDPESRTSTLISLAEPAGPDGQVRMSCIVDMCQYGNIMLIGSHQFIFIVNIDQLSLVGYWQVYTSSRLLKFLCIHELEQVWTISGNCISVWKMTRNMGVTLMKELEGHASKITSACLLHRKSHLPLSKEGSSKSKEIIVWSCSFDGQILAWDPDRVIGVHEAFLQKDDVPWEIMPINTRYIVINTHVSSGNDMISRLVFYRTNAVELRRSTSILSS